MRKDFGKKSWLFPEPVLMIGTYDENNNANVMNAAWGGMYDYNKVVIALSEHKTTDNLKITKAFSVSFATKKTLVESDYFGIESGKKVANKVEVAGFHPVKSKFVNAPIFKEYPVALECEVESFSEDGVLVGNIINVSADESVLTDGKIDPLKLEALVFDPFNNQYLVANEVAGDAFSAGLKLKK